MKLWPKQILNIFVGFVFLLFRLFCFFSRKADKLGKILENHPYIITSLFILVLMRTQVITRHPTLEVHSTVHIAPKPMRQNLNGNC